MLVGDNAVEVAGDGADVAVDGPLVVVQDHDHAPGLLGDVVHGFEGDAVGEGGVAGDGDDVLVAAGQVAGNGHAQRGGESGSGVARAVAVMLALGAQHEAVEAAGLADGVEVLAAAGEDLVDVGLVADVEEDLVLGRVENGVKGESELDDAEVGAEVAAGFGESLDEEFADLFGELGQLRITEGFRSAGEWMDSNSVPMCFLPPAAKKPPEAGVCWFRACDPAYYLVYPLGVARILKD